MGSEAIAPTLRPRSNQRLISDIKDSIASKHKVSHTGAQPAADSTDLTGHLTNGQIHSDPERFIEDDDGEADESDEEIKPVTRPQKISERKRRQMAIAASYMQNYSREVYREANKLSQEDEPTQSTRWLFNQPECRQIISTPREYQVELFNRAKEKNIIAVLDTGSGKTLISVLLLRHTIAQELEDRARGEKRRISFFLVDSVQLLFQQHAVLKANLDTTMNMFCGDMGCEIWKKELWLQHFNENMVIVCTAEVLRQCLHHSFISIDGINLLIFDEAHHAKKDHAYARIIKDFYAQQPVNTRLPKIFGMTASPVDARVDVRKAATELETILHCEIATAEDASLLQYLKGGEGKTEQVGMYAPLGPKTETALYKQIFQRIKNNPTMKKPLLFSYQCSMDLGSWCSDHMWTFCLTDQETMKLKAKTERLHRAKRAPDSMADLENRIKQIKEVRDIVQAYPFDPPDYHDNNSKSKNLSSKVVLLVRYLRERFERQTTDKCIVFVKQRYTARLLQKLFAQENIKTPWLKVGTLVGMRHDDVGDLKTSFREQVITMMNFRRGIINCLFATSVAEEGLDIPDCNLIIRFDLYATLIQYIQSRGRARHLNSKYLHFCEEHNHDQMRIIAEVRRNENILGEFCRLLPEDRKLTGNDKNLDAILAKEKTNRVFTIPETGAKLNYKTSLAVLANFVDMLPKAKEQNLQAEYIMTNHNRQFVCEVILPESSPVRGSVGLPANSKQIAKCSAAFETCLRLIEGKYLDQWLLPIFTKKVLPTMRSAKLALDSKRTSTYSMQTKPKMWSIGTLPDQFFVSVLKIAVPDALDRPSQPLAIMTRLPLPSLPSFDLNLGGGRRSAVECVSLGSIKLDAKQLNQINIFTLCIFEDVFSKSYAPDISTMPYLLFPARADYTASVSGDDLSTVVDWDVLKRVVDYQSLYGGRQWEDMSWKTEPDEYFRDRYIVDPFSGSRKLWCIGVAKDYKPLDPIPPNSAPGPGSKKNNRNIKDYSCSLWRKSKSRIQLDETQRVFEAQYISLRRNLLDAVDAPEDRTPSKCYVILQPLKISPLPPAVVTMAYVFPAIIYRVESYLIALEACELLHLTIQPKLALEAITKDCNHVDQNDTVKINFERGMGNNYERLEFLGDCFLKMSTSISLYGLQPENDEFAYHVDRMLLTSNANLKNNAIKLELYKFIRSAGFNRRAWYPEGPKLVKGKTAAAPDSHRLGDKTIADVCEALIGAALLSYHDSKNMDMAVRAVTELVCSENHVPTCFADYYKTYTKPEYQTQPASEIQKHMALATEEQHPYHFKYPRLLRSAFTHPSYPFSYEHVPSYQRLEFLGDALYDMVCVNFLFHRFPTKDPQWLTEHKMAMVSNMFLGALCVHLQFHTHLLLFNTSFQKQISDYVTDITEARSTAEQEAIEGGKSRSECSPDYWISVRHPPKCLPDIIEAYIGAIFVDSEYNYAEVEKFFDMHIAWFFRDMSIYDTFANKQPTTHLYNYMAISTGCMDWSIITSNLPNVDGSKSIIIAMVIIHGKVIAHAEAESSRYAKINVAKKAMHILEGMGLGEFRTKFECECYPEEADEAPGSEVEGLHGTAI